MPAPGPTRAGATKRFAMNLFRVVGCGVLFSFAPAAVSAQEMIRLIPDQNAQSMRVKADTAGQVFLALGQLGEPFRLGEIMLDVFPEFVLPLGSFDTGEVREFFIPRALYPFQAEAVLVDEKLRFHDSNVLSLLDVFPDLCAATFRAVLISTDSIPPYYTLGASLTAPTSGYDLKLDSVEYDGLKTDVYLRLVQPADMDLVMPVLTPHEIAVYLGSEVGNTVRVHMMRHPRGMVVPEVYRLMAELPVIKEW
jgi:hypothetical protein